jgi:peptidoglycan LD-endopeptidase LytH
MKRPGFVLFLAALLCTAASPEMCADPEMLQRVRREIYEDPTVRKERLEHEVFAARMLYFGTPIALPHRELLAFETDRVVPAVYELGITRGQEIRLTITPEKGALPDLRAGVFAHDGEKLRRLAVARAGEPLEARTYWSGTHYLVVEPGSKVAGSFVIEVRAGASITFPVLSKDSRAIKSFWGDRREGGRRSHQGVDIFADKGTAAIAAVDGWVARVGHSTLGGKVVWLVDGERSRYFYYAHLDAFEALEGSKVKAGDVLGYVGNTGNARSTPPHLHFGIYAPSAVDPMPYVHEPAASPRKISAKTDLVGRTVEVSAKRTSLLASPDVKATVVSVLEREKVVRILGASAAFYRVLVDERTVGYVRQEAVRASRRAA